jgi:hypothetical protein
MILGNGIFFVYVRVCVYIIPLFISQNKGIKKYPKQIFITSSKQDSGNEKDAPSRNAPAHK